MQYFLALVNNTGQVDERFNILTIMEKFGWTEEQYKNRPLWFDPIYEMKCQAEAKAQEVQNKSHE